jgi:hypothetical protein
VDIVSRVVGNFGQHALYEIRLLCFPIRHLILVGFSSLVVVLKQAEDVGGEGGHRVTRQFVILENLIVQDLHFPVQVLVVVVDFGLLLGHSVILEL